MSLLGAIASVPLLAATGLAATPAPDPGRSEPWIAVRFFKQPTVQGEEQYLGNSTYFTHQRVDYGSLFGVIGLAGIGMVASFGMTRRRPD